MESISQTDILAAEAVVLAIHEAEARWWEWKTIADKLAGVLYRACYSEESMDTVGEDAIAVLAAYNKALEGK